MKHGKHKGKMKAAKKQHQDSDAMRMAQEMGMLMAPPPHNPHAPTVSLGRRGPVQGSQRSDPISDWYMTHPNQGPPPKGWGLPRQRPQRGPVTPKPDYETESPPPKPKRR